MAFFKFRKGSEAKATASNPPAESVEVMRRRAKHRLVGTAVLVLVAVVGFPILFETQPRPVAVDIPIDIPDKNKVKPLGSAPGVPALASGPVEASAAKPAQAVAAGAVTSAPVATKSAALPASAPTAAISAVPASASLAVKEEILPAKAPAQAASVPKAAKPDDGAKAKALLEGKPVDAAEGSARFVVQVGAFADADKAREARLKLERAGLKTYAQVVETKDGKRTRVRLGPFSTRAQADEAAAKARAADLPAAILTL